METLLVAFFRIIEFFEVRSRNPVIAAFHHARRAFVIFLICQIAFLAMAFAIAPENEPAAAATMELVRPLRDMIADGFVIAGLTCMAGAAYFGLRCLHIYFRPERYTDRTSPERKRT